MKTGTLILDKNLAQISFEGNPSMTFGVNQNADGTKHLNGEQKWNPLKINFTNNYGNEILDGNYEVAYLCENNSSTTYKLTGCILNAENKEIIFNSCQLFD